VRSQSLDSGLDDSDAAAVRRASRIVGLQITLAFGVLVLAVLVAAFTFVFSHIKPAVLFDFHGRHETTIDVGATDILVAGLLIGAVAVILVGTISWFATRRAVRPLGDALRAQRAFVADASHELRTPLTVLDARLQLHERNLGVNHEARETVTQLRQDTRTLIEIVNDLLAAAEVGGARADRRHPVEILPVVTLAIESMRIVAIDKSIAIALRAPAGHPAESIRSYVPAGSIHRCAIALLDNAVAFSPPGSTITVSLRATKSTVTLAVRDEGAGVQGIDPARIFDRFARSAGLADDSSSGRTGFGIGLSLVRDTVERFGGTAVVAETSAAGTEIRLTLPRAHS
jgi:two-component system OmpR family sensor kinase